MNYLDDTGVIILVSRGQNDCESKDRVTHQMEGHSWIDALDYVDGYTVMMKNGGLDVTKWNLATLRVRKDDKGIFLFEGRLWQMDVRVLVVTVDSVVILH